MPRRKASRVRGLRAGPLAFARGGRDLGRAYLGTLLALGRGIGEEGYVRWCDEAAKIFSPASEIPATAFEVRRGDRHVPATVGRRHLLGLGDAL